MMLYMIGSVGNVMLQSCDDSCRSLTNVHLIVHTKACWDKGVNGIFVSYRKSGCGQLWWKLVEVGSVTFGYDSAMKGLVQ